MHREEIELATKVEDEVEEDLEEVEVYKCATTSNNEDTMQGNVHLHMQHVCIFAQQTMTQKIV
jgi:hypothetical protein